MTCLCTFHLTLKLILIHFNSFCWCNLMLWWFKIFYIFYILYKKYEYILLLLLLQLNYFSIIFTRIEHIKHISRLALFSSFTLFLNAEKQPLTRYPTFKNIAIKLYMHLLQCCPMDRPAFKAIITYLTKILNMIFQCYFSNWCNSMFVWLSVDNTKQSWHQYLVLIAESERRVEDVTQVGQKRIQRVLSDPM